MADKNWTSKGVYVYGNTGVIYDCLGAQVAAVQGSLVLGVTGEGRAKRIVLAMNCHDALVAALEEIKDELFQLRCLGFAVPTSRLTQIGEMAQEALAKAKE
ncbi:MAG: hypothetical protein WC593_15630 [Methanoregula sp.]